MDAKHDPNVVMHVSIFKLGGWNTSQPTIQTSLGEFMDEVVGGNPTQRTVSCDAVLGTTLCEFRSTHEER